MAKHAIAKRRNPQDATLRNVRAARVRVSDLQVRLADLDRRVRSLEKAAFEAALRKGAR